MTGLSVRATVLAAFLATLAAVPVAATVDIIDKGTDYWVTRPNGNTQFTFPSGDVEALCKAPVSNGWDHKVLLRGVPARGSDWDSAVARLLPAKFDKTGNAHTKVQFVSLAMVSKAPSDTPCGKLDWQARLAKGKQPITAMRIKRDNTKGGRFFADLAVRVEMQANNANTGAYVGSLFYDIKLPDQAGGTVWSYGDGRAFRAGMTENEDCLPALREKLATLDPNDPEDARHVYWISEMIAAKQCRRRD